jgi:hypothetical protein
MYDIEQQDHRKLDAVITIDHPEIKDFCTSVQDGSLHGATL